MTPVALRTVKTVSYVTRIKHSKHFAWQAQYLVMLEGDTYLLLLAMSVPFHVRLFSTQ